MSSRAVLFAGALLFSTSVAVVAKAEVHETAHDVRVVVDTAGLATIDHAVSYRVVSGALKSVEIPGFEAELALDEEVKITGDGIASGRAHAHDRSVTIDVDEPKGLKRGVYALHLRYRVDLVKNHEITRDGALWRISWASPVPAEGIDGSRVVFRLPAAETEPRTVRDEADALLTTLRRDPEADELEMVRPHVARGEAVVWSARVDPRAFPRVQAPELRPPPPPPAVPETAADPSRPLALSALGILFAALVWAKSKRFDTACREAKASTPIVARSILPLPLLGRVILAGFAFSGGIALEMADTPAFGACLLGLAMLASAHASPVAAVRTRGPGQWLAFRYDEAFSTRSRSSDPFDPATLAGKCTLVLLTLGTALAAFLLHKIDPEISHLVILDAVSLAPLFLTGTRAQLPPTSARASAPMLRALFRKFKAADLRVLPWARVPTGATEPDELRLLVLPTTPMPGVVGIEVGLAWARSGAGYAGNPEVLVRVQDASAASARMTVLAPLARAVPGRRPEERVIRLRPRLATRAATRELVLSLARELEDRRSARKTSFEGDDRRVAKARSPIPRASPPPSPRDFDAIRL
jgi:hypothetical protein